MISDIILDHLPFENATHSPSVHASSQCRALLCIWHSWAWGPTWMIECQRLRWQIASFQSRREFPRWVLWRSPWAGLELNSMLYIHIKREKYGRYSCLYDAEINLSAWLGVNLLPAFAKYCFTLCYTIFYLLLAINIKQHKGVMFSSILLQNDNKFAAL